jgi:hypothetical protein
VTRALPTLSNRIAPLKHLWISTWQGLVVDGFLVAVAAPPSSHPPLPVTGKTPRALSADAER